MKRVSVVSIKNDEIVFSDGSKLYSEHERDCCEHHYLGFGDIIIEDFIGLLFDLTVDSFFEKIPEYGIALKPFNGYPVRIPGYGSNNGYYSTELVLVLETPNKTYKYDITDCQTIDG
jgi:hypothetical protein